ncbi:hypothetical protein CTheo_5727 [Ceratobasidium theobromae]|uniref:Uncharacterized protein n=1 Tax=Ceratobasidium theobromae TaxID=1582974 RepID=A0A5N5QHQ2_9AGAM|nr:hypothetical protein CTheo_5727 [Ceratobasidium theobromae]
MDTLSRREEDTLLKATKAKALKDCDELVKVQSLRSVRLAGPSALHGHVGKRTRTCRRAYTDSMYTLVAFSPIVLTLGHSTCPENMEKVRAEYVRLRRQPAEP